MLRDGGSGMATVRWVLLPSVYQRWVDFLTNYQLAHNQLMFLLCILRGVYIFLHLCLSSPVLFVYLLLSHSPVSVCSFCILCLHFHCSRLNWGNNWWLWDFTEIRGAQKHSPAHRVLPYQMASPTPFHFREPVVSDRKDARRKEATSKTSKTMRKRIFTTDFWFLSLNFAQMLWLPITKSCLKTQIAWNYWKTTTKPNIFTCACLLPPPNNLTWYLLLLYSPHLLYLDHKSNPILYDTNNDAK